MGFWHLPSGTAGARSREPPGGRGNEGPAAAPPPPAFALRRSSSNAHAQQEGLGSREGYIIGAAGLAFGPTRKLLCPNRCSGGGGRRNRWGKSAGPGERAGRERVYVWMTVDLVCVCALLCVCVRQISLSSPSDDEHSAASAFRREAGASLLTCARAAKRRGVPLQMRSE